LPVQVMLSTAIFVLEVVFRNITDVVNRTGNVRLC
jgi:hypothetical protein